MDAEIRARARAQVVALAYDDTAEDLDEALLTSCKTPAIFTMIVEPVANKKAIGSKDQVIQLDVRVGVVTQSLGPRRSAPLKGSTGNYALRNAVKKALHDWKPSGALRKLEYRGNEFVGRAGARVCYELKFETSIHETYS